MIKEDDVGDPWLSAWAKTDDDAQRTNVVTEWLPLSQHLSDTAGVAGLLVEHWASPQVVRRIAADLGGDARDVQRLAMWLAAVHDVGKISPAFVVQAPQLADAMRTHGLDAPPTVKDDTQRSRARHEYIGQVAVREFLVEVFGLRHLDTAALGVVVGGHHGVPAEPGQIALVRERPDLAGTGAWHEARQGALKWATDLIGGDDVLRPYANARLGRPAQALLTAIVIMADWIASNTKYFPLRPAHTARETPVPPDPRVTAARVADGWRELDLPHRWAADPIEDVAAAFAARFGRPATTMRPVQRAAAEVAATSPSAGMIVIEAPMGEGKTEAALLAAEVLAARSGADGCFVALPTRATTDAMFSRVLDWMQNLPGLPGDVSVLLAHGTASLNDEYLGLMRRAHLSGVGVEGGIDEVGIAHHWLRGRKKGALAQFVIGTVDQVLFAGLKSRHLMLRHLGLAGKVVVIDEVHAYDCYMSRYLDRVLHWLGAYGTPVVLLSATLPAARRAELVHAYDSGRDASPTVIGDDPGYPVVLASGLPPRATAAAGTPHPITIEHRADDLDTLVTLLRESLADGGCAVVIRNTVTRVQEAAERLVAEFGDDAITVTHSRFLACDRARLDTDLLRRFGPPGDEMRRPRRHIVVASQVVEQSLDVDFDLMVTDLAPVDLVLQRMGRLHRHTRPRPPGLAQPRCILVGVEDWAATPVRAVAGSRRVYGEHLLLRSAALFADRATVTVPTDIPALVQGGYGPDALGPQSWQPAMAEAAHADMVRTAERREEAAKFLLAEAGKPKHTLEAWVRAGVGDTDDGRQGNGQVRDGDETLEVLVVQRDRDSGILTPSWIPDGGARQIPVDGPIEDRLARVIAACVLRLPPGLCRMNPVGDGVVRALERNHFTSFDQHPLLKGQLVLVLDEDGTAELRDAPAAFRLAYDLRRGLRYEAL